MKRPQSGFLASFFRVRSVLTIALTWVAMYYVAPCLAPLPAGLEGSPRPGTELTDRDGRPLRKLLVDGQRVDQPLDFSDIPRELVDAIVSAEDQRFWNHGGIDFVGLVRATIDSAKAGRPVSGASTITQQLVKIARKRYENRTWRDKVVETLTARKIEMFWNKERILTAYLERVEFGNQSTGCATAARGYFRKPLGDLSLAECAFLAGLPQAPTRLNPYRNFEAAKRRQQWVLARMREDGRISETQEKAAAAEPLGLRRWAGDFEAPHFVDMLLGSTEWPALAESATVRTSLDLELQHFCERVVTSRIARLRPHNVHDAAIVVIDNASGGIRALVGSPDYFDDQTGQINGAFAPRSAGSTLKPFTYLLAFQNGAAPATIVDDLPVEFVTPTGIYRPENYDRKSHGPVSYRDALANSLNISAVRVLQRIGGPAVLASALEATGLTTLDQAPEHYGLGLTIGNAEARLVEIASAYACLARLGTWRPISLLDKNDTTRPATDVTADDAGLSRLNAPREIFDRAACWLIADILSDNNARARSFGLSSALRLPFPAAVKTGTSTDFRDNWCVGFTPQFTVAVWVGNFDRRPMSRVSGVTGAAPLWREIFLWLDKQHGSTWYPPDPNIIEIEVDPLTGLRVPPHLAGRRPTVREKFHAGTAPSLSTAARYDSLGRVLLGRDYARWLRGPDNWLGSQAVVGLEPSLDTPLIITSPLAGATILLDPDLPQSGCRLRLRTNLPDEHVHWSSDTLAIEKSNRDSVARLEKGRHRITARNPETGATTETWVNVKSL